QYPLEMQLSHKGLVHGANGIVLKTHPHSSHRYSLVGLHEGRGILSALLFMGRPPEMCDREEGYRKGRRTTLLRL
ncbi:MAG: hypothetical protein IJ810_01865, partial [Candidatus Methanomethylophilus sp.]|nr:hypothetical protein [Methanomethylophilus sp.]